MAWQDEMNALDSAVAAGRVTAEEYRTQRDELLASSGTGTAVGEGNPFPPPFRWGERAPGAAEEPDPADRTQVVRPSSAADADLTQVVRPGSAAPESALPDADLTQVVNPDADRTQVVRPGAPLPAQEYTPGSPPWQATPPPAGPPPPSRPGGTAPPWNTGDGFTPRQGPDSFGELRAKPPGGRWVAPVVAVVVAIAVIGAITFFAQRGGGSGTAGGPATTTAAGSASPSPTAAPTTPPSRLPVADLPGTTADTSGVRTFADVQAQKFLGAEEVAALGAAGAGESQLALSDDSGTRVVVLVVQTSDPASAMAAATALTSTQVAFGLVAQPPASGATITSSAAGVRPPLRRVHYASGRYVVRIEVTDSDPARTTSEMSTVLAAQLAALPAGS